MRKAPVRAALAVALLAACSTNPVTGRRQLDLIGEDQEVQLGASVYPAYVQQSLGALDDRELQAMVDRVGQSVARVSHRPELPYRFTVVNDPQVNAFALPGGKIAITRGMVSRLHSEDGLAAVLGHEVGHVAARHVVAGYNRQLLTQMLLIGGGALLEANDVRQRDAIMLGGLVGAQLALAHYSREQERQSDELGLEYAVRAGYSPRGMLETHQILVDLSRAGKGKGDKMFASHPASGGRLERAREEIRAMPPDLRDKPVDETAFRRAAADVIAARPAWDRAAEGQAHLGAGRAREAEQAFAEAVRREPDEGVLRTLHAASLAAIDREGAAVAEARRGAETAPEVFVSQLVAAQLLVRSDPADTIGYLRRAEGILPGNALVAYLAGQAQERVGDRSAAVGSYRVALERDPEGRVGQAAARRLQALGYAAGGVGTR